MTEDEAAECEVAADKLDSLGLCPRAATILREGLAGPVLRYSCGLVNVRAGSYARLFSFRLGDDMARAGRPGGYATPAHTDVFGDEEDHDLLLFGLSVQAPEVGDSLAFSVSIIWDRHMRLHLGTLEPRAHFHFPQGLVWNRAGVSVDVRAERTASLGSIDAIDVRAQLRGRVGRGAGARKA